MLVLFKLATYITHFINLLKCSVLNHITCLKRKELNFLTFGKMHASLNNIFSYILKGYVPLRFSIRYLDQPLKLSHSNTAHVHV